MGHAVNRKERVDHFDMEILIGYILLTGVLLSWLCLLLDWFGIGQG
jgi:hypothetical protein